MPLDGIRDDHDLLRLGAFALLAVAALVGVAQALGIATIGLEQLVEGLFVLVTAVGAGAAAYLTWEDKTAAAGVVGLVAGLGLVFFGQALPGTLALGGSVLAFVTDHIARRRHTHARPRSMVIGMAK